MGTQQIDLTAEPGGGAVEIHTPAGIIWVNTGLVNTRTGVPVVKVEVEPNLSGLGIVRTNPGGHWVTEIHDRHGTRTDIRLTKEG